MRMNDLEHRIATRTHALAIEAGFPYVRKGHVLLLRGRVELAGDWAFGGTGASYAKLCEFAERARREIV